MSKEKGIGKKKGKNIIDGQGLKKNTIIKYLKGFGQNPENEGVVFLKKGGKGKKKHFCPPSSHMQMIFLVVLSGES